MFALVLDFSKFNQEQEKLAERHSNYFMRREIHESSQEKTLLTQGKMPMTETILSIDIFPSPYSHC